MIGSNHDPLWTEEVAALIERVWSPQRLQEAAA
jgi:hypothetical protein